LKIFVENQSIIIRNRQLRNNNPKAIVNAPTKTAFPSLILCLMLKGFFTVLVLMKIIPLNVRHKNEANNIVIPMGLTLSILTPFVRILEICFFQMIFNLE